MAATPRVLTKSQRIGLLQQSKGSNHWDAVQLESANFETQFYDKGGSTPEPNVTLDGYNNMNGAGGVMDEYDNVVVDSITGLKEIPFSGICTKKTLAKHLIGCFQSVNEGATTPYTKQFKFADDVLDWSQNEGYLHTVAFDTGISGRGILLSNALLSEYSVVVETSPQTNGAQRFVKHSGKWAGNVMSYNNTLSGTWTVPAKTLFNTAVNPFEPYLDLTIGATALEALPFFRFEFKYTSGLAGDFAAAGGKAGNYIWMPKAQFLIDIPYRSDTAPYLAMFAAGSNAKVVSLDNGLATDGMLIFSNTYGHLATNPYKADGEYIGTRIEINIERPTNFAAWGDIMQLADAIDGAY